MDEGQERIGRVVLVGGILFYVVLQTFFFPTYYSQADEGCYVSMAFVFANGRISGEGLDVNLYRFSRVDGRLVGEYDCGMGWLLVPFTVFGPRALFAFNILMHLAGFVVFYLLLRRLELHPAFSWLYLLDPTLWYHSRNIVNDLPAGVFFLVGFYFLLVAGRAVLAAGLCFALAIFTRPASVVFVAPFLLAWTVAAFVAAHSRPEGPTGRREVWKKIGMLALGAAPPLIALVLYNVTVMHSLLGISQARLAGGQAPFSLTHVPFNLLRYGVSLNVLYPGMAVLFFLYRGPLRWPLVVAGLVGGFFYMTYVDWGLGGAVQFGSVESLVLGPRYLEVVLPLVLVTYAWWADRFARRFGKPVWIAYGIAVLLLLTGDAAMTALHQRHMDQAAYFRNELFGNTPKGALILMDEPVRTRISSDVKRSRKLLTVFPFEEDPAKSVAGLDDLLARQGEAYVPELFTGGEIAAPPRAVRDRDIFLARHPREVILDVERQGWRLKITRVKPAN